MPMLTRRAALAGLVTLSATATALDGVMARLALAAPAESAADQAFNAFLEAVWQEELARSPEMRTRLELPGRHDGWTLPDDGYQQESLRIAAENRRRLLDFNPADLSPSAQISHRLFKEKLETAIAFYHWRFHQYTVSHLEGAHTNIPSFLIGYHAVKRVEDAEDYIKRLQGIGTLIDITIEQMRKQAAKGVLPPAFSYPRILKAAENVIKGAPFDSGADSPLFADLKQKVEALDISPDRKRALIQAGRQALTGTVRPAYIRFLLAVDALAQTQKQNNGVWALPEGANYYRAQIRYHTGLEMTAEEIHALGLSETARLHEELRAAMARLNFQGSVQDFFNFVRTDPSLRFPDSAAGRQEYLATATAYIEGVKARLSEMFTVLPKAQVVVKAVEPYRENATPSAFYEQSSPDGSRPGVFYANLSDMSVQTRHDLEALCHHEALPGHHMQIAIAQEADGIPTFRRFTWDTAYGEGWAMYTERMTKEFGFYKEPLSEAGRIISELFRAGRLVVDTGIHAKQWTREQAIAWMNENTANPLSDNENEIERYFVWPGQALGYKIGMNKILELREQAKATLGAKFDIRAFHDVVLTNGPVSLPILEEVVTQWVAARARAA